MSNWVLTGKTRLGLVHRAWRRPLVGLEVQYEDRSYWEKYPTKWEIASLGDLTQLQGIYPKANPQGLRFRAHTKFFNATVLVLQINDDPEGNRWRDARVEDLADLPDHPSS